MFHKPLILYSIPNNNTQYTIRVLLFQFLNPKAWIVALTVVTVFFPNEENFIKATLFVSLSAPLMCFFSVITWAGFGSSIRVFISNKKIKKFIEVLMALLLAVTAVFMLI